MAAKKKKQTDNRRRNGKFAPGNKAGKQFEPGESGNPAGRPKRTRLTDALTVKLAENAPGASEETIAERIAQALVDEALNGNVQAIREIGDRTEGKPRQALDINATLMDWREMAKEYGLSEDDVINEAKQLIESAADSSDAESD
jgi:hypothetical protein